MKIRKQGQAAGRHCSDCYNRENEYNDKVVAVLDDNESICLPCLLYRLTYWLY